MLALFALAGLSASWMMAADDTDAKDRPDRAGNYGVQMDDSQHIGHVFRGTHFMGMTVRNDKGENLGTVNDLVMDFECHQVRYAAISFGGVLGFGDKLFAVPLSAMALRHDSSRDKPYLLFNVTSDRLKESPGFDQNHWPDVADPAWSRKIDDFYGVTYDDTSVGVEVKGRARDAEKSKEHRGHHVIRASHLKGMAVENNSNEDLGRVTDFVIDAKSGHITHLAVRHGAVAGLGGEFTMVPMSNFTMKVNVANDKRMLVIPVSAQHFKDAPRISDEWPNLNDEGWSQRFDRYFEESNAKNL